MAKRAEPGDILPKHSLSLPDLDQAGSEVFNGLPPKESQRGYRHALGEFIAWYCSEPRFSFNKTVVTGLLDENLSPRLNPTTRPALSGVDARARCRT